jgi:hypothetical protein
MLFGVGIGNSVIAPSAVMRPMRFPVCSENHMFPSDPSAMMRGELPGLGSRNSRTPVPSGFMRPIAFPAPRVNQSVPSPASAIVVGPLLGVGKGN